MDKKAFDVTFEAGRITGNLWFGDFPPIPPMIIEGDPHFTQERSDRYIEGFWFGKNELDNGG